MLPSNSTSALYAFRNLALALFSCSFPAATLEVAAGFVEEVLNASEQVKIARLRLRLGLLLEVLIVSS